MGSRSKEKGNDAIKTILESSPECKGKIEVC